MCVTARLIVLLALALHTKIPGTGGLETLDCEAAMTCGECLLADYNCAWCSDKTYKEFPRCLTRDQLVEFGCNDAHIWFNDQKTSILSDGDLQDFQEETHGATQVRPQRVQMKLVKSHTQQIKLTYRPARNYPLDLYFLMDLTWTMRDDKDTLIKMGAELSEALRNLTGNYRLGFGSFADKPAMPMIMPHLKQNPCAVANVKCEPTYDFRHRLELTEDTHVFVQSVAGGQITGNLDNFEGGMDALMQVIVCADKVGWKEEARKIVLLVTDGYMHFAGDGLLAGITRRNDRMCHLDESGEYTGSLEYDYPSLEEIYRELVKRKISVIFAVTSNVQETYRQMSELMDGVSNVEKIAEDSSNILKVIKSSYERFLKTAKFTDDSPSFISVTYETDCGGRLAQKEMRNQCNELEMGVEVDIFVNVTLNDFPDDGIYKRTIRIGESALSEYLTLDIEIQKPCPCEEGIITDDEARSYCSDHGALKCGECVCDEGWVGLLCSCYENGTTMAGIMDKCRKPTSFVGKVNPICSDHGECDCGECLCDYGYSGRYCECPECSNCDLEMAYCSCGECICKYGWNGKRCNCKDSTDGCLTPTGEVCSSHGKCDCGKCDCDLGYTGQTCEITFGGFGDDFLNNSICEFYVPCVKCLIQQKKGTFYCTNASIVCATSDGHMPDYEIIVGNRESGGVCRASVENQTHYFIYKMQPLLKTYSLKIWIQDYTPLDLVQMGGYISILTFIVGFVFVVLYMCCVRVRNAREYALFEKQKKEQFLRNMENPLYKNPITNYYVPKSEEDILDDMYQTAQQREAVKEDEKKTCC